MQFKKISINVIFITFVGIAISGCSNDKGAEGGNGHGHSHSQ